MKTDCDNCYTRRPRPKTIGFQSRMPLVAVSTHLGGRGQIPAATVRTGRIFNKEERQDERIDWNESSIGREDGVQYKRVHA